MEDKCDLSLKIWISFKDKFYEGKRERQRSVTSLSGSCFSFFRKLNYTQMKLLKKNVKVAKTSTHRKSRIKCAYASLFQLPYVLMVTQSSVTLLGFVLLFWFGFFILDCFVAPPTLHSTQQQDPCLNQCTGWTTHWRWRVVQTAGCLCLVCCNSREGSSKAAIAWEGEEETLCCA